jgi:hypothetical protein
MGFFVLTDDPIDSLGRGVYNAWKYMYVEGEGSVAPNSNHELLGVSHIKHLKSAYTVKFI